MSGSRPDMNDIDHLTAWCEADGIHSVRAVFTDQHGHLRGKTVSAAALPNVVERGIGVPGSLLHKDTGNTYAVDLWKPTGDATLDALVGARNIILRPDPATFRTLPWAPGSAIVLCDIETESGASIAHSPRTICARALDRLESHGLGFVAGLELEFHLYARADDGTLTHTHPGWDLLGEEALDRIEPVVEPIRAGLTAMGLAPSTIEAELGPSQIEMTFAPATGLDIADQAVLVRAAIRNMARRSGHHATFMSRPSIGDASFPSGWHLHQSLVDLDAVTSGAGSGGTGSSGARSGGSGPSRFMPGPNDELLAPLGRQWVAGLLHHAPAACLLTTPTVTGYKRYRPRAVTPDRISWSKEHRGAMLRVVGGPGDAGTRVENRAGDPAANPYLLVASQVLSGLDGIDNQRTPPPPTDSPYEADGGEHLPRSLGEAIDHFDSSAMFRAALGDDVVDYLLTLKRSEWHRFCAAVTDWEQHEYLDLY